MIESFKISHFLEQEDPQQQNSLNHESSAHYRIYKAHSVCIANRFWVLLLCTDQFNVAHKYIFNNTERRFRHC